MGVLHHTSWVANLRIVTYPLPKVRKFQENFLFSVLKKGLSKDVDLDNSSHHSIISLTYTYNTGRGTDHHTHRSYLSSSTAVLNINTADINKQILHYFNVQKKLRALT